MDNVQIVKEITDAFCENRIDDQVLARYFAPNFEHVANGRHTNLQGYSHHLADYKGEYTRFRIPARDELFAAGDKVVASSTLEAQKRSGETHEMSIMAIWRLVDGKVTSLREVDAASERSLSLGSHCLSDALPGRS